MSLLDGDLAAIIGEVFSDGDMRFLRAIRYRNVLTRLPGGDTVTTPTERPCLAMVDKCSESMRRADGYTSLDMALIFLGTSLNPTGATEADMTSDDEAMLLEGPYSNVRWAIASVEIDPAGATVTTRGQRA